MRSLVSRFLPILPAVILLGGSLAVSSMGCGDSETVNGLTTGSGGSGGSGSGTGGGSTGGGGAAGCPDAPMADGCTVTVAPSDDDYTSIQTAFQDASAGDTICFCPGTFSVEREISLAKENITVRGAGAKLDDVVLDFKKQTKGDDAWSVTADGFSVENLTIKNTPGNGLIVTGAKGVTFKNMKAYWDAGSDKSNGKYAVYPVSSQNVLIDTVEVVGAADAGIYVGQCTNSIVKNSKVHGSVAGIESENNTNCEIFGNESYDNTAGILVFALPNKEKKDALDTNVHDNKVHDNNRDNFGDSTSTVGAVPSGIGILILAADYAEVHDNEVTNQKTVGLTMVSLGTFKLLDPSSTDDPETDPYPEHAYIHDNKYTHIGYDPDSPLDLLKTSPVENIIWDGDQRTAGTDDMQGSVDLCLGTDNTATFRNVEGIANIATPANQSTDTTLFLCKGKVHDPVKF
jgi:parallel beta-helix repeat protein